MCFVKEQGEQRIESDRWNVSSNLVVVFDLYFVENYVFDYLHSLEIVRYKEIFIKMR